MVIQARNNEGGGGGYGGGGGERTPPFFFWPKLDFLMLNSCTKLARPIFSAITRPSPLFLCVWKFLDLSLLILDAPAIQAHAKHGMAHHKDLS